MKKTKKMMIGIKKISKKFGLPEKAFSELYKFDFDFENENYAKNNGYFDFCIISSDVKNVAVICKDGLVYFY